MRLTPGSFLLLCALPFLHQARDPFRARMRALVVRISMSTPESLLWREGPNVRKAQDDVKRYSAEVEPRRRVSLR